MRLRLKTKFTLATALLVLGVATLYSGLYVARLTHQVIEQHDARARFVAQQVFLQSQHALADAADSGQGPASESPEDLRRYVQQALDENAGLTSLIDASVGYSPSIYEVTIADRQGTALISSDASLPGRPVMKRARLEELANASFLRQLRVLYGPPQVYEFALAFNLGDQPFGAVRVGLSTALLRNEIAPGLRTAGWLSLGLVMVSTLLAAAVSHVSLAPLARISAQLDGISKGQFEAAPVAEGDELGQVSTKISQIGQQLRGVQEIFSTLRQSMDQVIAGLDDGLLLFAADGRAVLASPAVEKFLGAKPEALLGRRAGEVFPPGHPLHDALKIEGDQLGPVEGVEVQLNSTGRGGVSRASASVHIIAERDSTAGAQMGALVTLRDLESIERLGSHLETSERLSALGRVTAGVAHEVKNPLNSMRLWLENLKQTLPPAETASGSDAQTAQQAVKILDSEIDRLDRVVKIFLDFTRPVAPDRKETNLAELLEEVAVIAGPQAERAGVEIVRKFPAENLSVRADRQLIKQAVLNLVLNAFEAMQDRPLRSLTLALERRGENSLITVADTGLGIAPEHRGRIFQLFFTTRKGGSGIGLATTYRIVQLHDGTIDFESEPGRGTAFRIQLPLATAVAHPTPPVQAGMGTR